jgi:hypothetical protein
MKRERPVAVIRRQSSNDGCVPQSRPQALALRMSDLGCKVQIETLIAIANQDRFRDRFYIL